MHCLYLLSLLLLLGVDAKPPTDGGKKNNDDISVPAILRGQENPSTLITYFGSNPKQLRELEIALNNVVTNLLGPQQRKLSLGTTENGNTSSIDTLQIISDAICEKIKTISEKSGLIRRTKSKSLYNPQPNNRSLKAALYYQLLRIPLIISPIWREVQTKMTNHLKKKEYVRMGYTSPNFVFLMNDGISTDQLKISAIMEYLAKYANSFSSCLEEKKSDSFDLKKALAKLTNYSPEVTKKIMIYRLGKPLSESPGNNKEEYNTFHAFVCRSATEGSQENYVNCLVEIKRINTCVQEKVNGSSEVTKLSMKSSKDFLRMIKGLDDSCENADKGMGVLVGCKLKAKATRSNVFPDIVDFFMGDLKKSSELGRMAMKVGSIITKSRLGSEALNEVTTLIKIYKHGVEKKAKLMKAAQRNVHQRSIFTKISTVLSQYKQHISDVTHSTIARMHNVMSRMEKFIVDSASTIVGEDLLPNIRTLERWSGLVDSVVTDLSHNRSQFPAKPIARHRSNSDKFVKDSKHLRSRGLIKVRNEVGFIKNPHEEHLKKLVDSMKRLGQRSSSRRPTTLITLANTFLLTAMFYECVALITGTLYYDTGSSVSTNIRQDTEEPEHKSPDQTRSWAPIDHENVMTPFQFQAKEHETEPLSLTNEIDKANSNTVNLGYERNPESEGNSFDSEVSEKLNMNLMESSIEYLN